MSVAARLAQSDGLAARCLRRVRAARNAGCVTILAYHRISADPSPLTAGQDLTLHPALLDRQMALLARRWRPVRLSGLLDALDQGRTLRRAVVVTFDDGFAETLHVAAPILRRHGVPLAACINTGVIGNEDLLWRHKLSWLLASPVAALTRDAILHEYARRGIRSLRNEDLLAFTRRRFIPDHLPPLLEDLLRRAGTSGRDLAARLRPYLEPRDLARADADWIEFANHTHSHPVLSALPPANQHREIAAARDALLAWTSRPPLAVAYPFGLRDDYAPGSAEIARATGHRAALDLRRRVNRPGVSPLELSRRPVPSLDGPAFERWLEDFLPRSRSAHRSSPLA